MSEKNNNNQDLKTARRTKLDRKLDAVGWGLFFIWIGMAILANVGWGLGLIGIGTIILGSVVAREYLSGPDGSSPVKANC
jgi:hypothetical protein